MQKIVGSISRGQAHEILNQIEDALKASNVDPFEFAKKMIGRQAFKKMILDYVKKSAKFQSQESEKFERTDTIVSITPSGKTYNVKEDRKSLVATKEEGGPFDYIDGDIENWFGDVSYADTVAVSGRVQAFKKTLDHRSIIEEGQRLEIYEEYDIVQGLMLTNELAKAGALNKPGFGVIIYLKNTKNGNRYRLRAGRSTDGGLGLRVGEVDLGDGWRAGGGALFSN